MSNLTDTSGRDYTIGECLGSGGHGTVCAGIDSRGQEVAIKMEPINDKNAITLDSERRIYDRLGTHQGIPKFYGWGKTSGNEQFIVIERLGDPMSKIIAVKKNLHFDEIRYLAVQLLRIIEYIHHKGVSYGDFNNGNVIWNRGKKTQIYLTDFGIATLFMLGGKHIPYKKKKVKSPEGTAIYASLDAHDGATVSRRGDLESLGYLLGNWESGDLPWTGTPIQNMILLKKSWMPTSPRLQEYWMIVKNLRYDEEPNYSQLINIFLKS